MKALAWLIGRTEKLQSTVEAICGERLLQFEQRSVKPTRHSGPAVRAVETKMPAADVQAFALKGNLTVPAPRLTGEIG